VSTPHFRALVVFLVNSDWGRNLNKLEATVEGKLYANFKFRITLVEICALERPLKASRKIFLITVTRYRNIHEDLL
jgi:hypothetical protein